MRGLEGNHPYLILDATYHRVRENGVVAKKAVLIALGVNEEGKRSILGLDLENLELSSSCLRLIRALAVKQHEEWPEGSRYLNMELLKEHKKMLLNKKVNAA